MKPPAIAAALSLALWLALAPRAAVVTVTAPDG